MVRSSVVLSLGDIVGNHVGPAICSIPHDGRSTLVESRTAPVGDGPLSMGERSDMGGGEAATMVKPFTAGVLSMGDGDRCMPQMIEGSVINYRELKESSEIAASVSLAGILARDADLKAEGNDALRPPRLPHSQVGASFRSGFACIEGFAVEAIHAILHVRFFQLAAERSLSSVGAELLATDPVAGNDGSRVLCSMCLRGCCYVSVGRDESQYEATQNQLARGQRLRELLKQSQSAPLTLSRMPLKESATMVEPGKEGAITNRPVILVTTDCLAKDDLVCSMGLAGISVGAERPALERYL
ncbi:hypothetical protein NE237_008993 [Protea cynaroides]|uniref:Uncharacterized protein n=1 Tax=Protea cynaroides TaxID=273540 RepID=A0A9Q0KWQ4_9MAGN|nr:hypothetical protein NE237_008993 [Protea cynaroides]